MNQLPTRSMKGIQCEDTLNCCLHAGILTKKLFGRLQCYAMVCSLLATKANTRNSTLLKREINA